MYRCGNLIDPCRGPHLPDTGRVKAYAVVKNSSSYFRGDAAAMAADINSLVAAEAVQAKRALADARAYVYVDTDAPGSVPMDVVEDW